MYELFKNDCQNCLQEALVKLGQAVKILIKFYISKTKNKNKKYNQLFQSLYS
jgi:hypothetical protein